MTDRGSDINDNMIWDFWSWGGWGPVCHVLPCETKQIDAHLFNNFVTFCNSRIYKWFNFIIYVFSLMSSGYFNSLQWKLGAEWAFYCNVYNFVKIWLQMLMTHWVPGRAEQLLLRNSKKKKRVIISFLLHTFLLGSMCGLHMRTSGISQNLEVTRKWWHHLWVFVKDKIKYTEHIWRQESLNIK